MTTIRRFVLRLLSFFRPGAAEAARMDFKLGARMLAKYPGLSLIGGAGQAVGVAIGAGFFAFFYSFLYATLPVEGGERIVALENWDIDANDEMRRSMHDLVMWQREMKTVGEIGAFRTIARNLTFTGGPVEAVQVAQITAAGFNITRVAPLIGRAIVAADESAGASPIVVIGYDVWHSRLGGDASVLGRELRLGNVVHTIVGVMPEGYGFPVNHSYWIPLSTDAATIGPREGPDIFIFGRLRDGAAMAQAQAELSALGAQAASAFPLTHARLQPRVMPYAHPILDIQGITTRDFTALQSLISMLALIVAVNVGVLVYARTATRQREIAVRTALGASRRRIVGQLFIEQRQQFTALRLQRLARPHPLGDLPLVVITNGVNKQKAQLQALSTSGQLVIAEGSCHEVHVCSPDLVIDAIRRVVNMIRNPR